jgi:hypothetical protein
MPEYTIRRRQEDPWLFKTYPVNSDKRSLRVRVSSDQYFADEEGIFRTERMYGNIMHRIFSGIHSENDLELVMADMRKEGLISREEMKELELEIREKINRPEVKAWFSSERQVQVHNEHPIFCSSGEVLRPDRVIVGEDIVTVIDFKFGELEKNAHRVQVQTYMEKLLEMRYANVEGYLWYVMLDKIVKI